MVMALAMARAMAMAMDCKCRLLTRVHYERLGEWCSF